MAAEGAPCRLAVATAIFSILALLPADCLAMSLFASVIIGILAVERGSAIKWSINHVISPASAIETLSIPVSSVGYGEGRERARGVCALAMRCGEALRAGVSSREAVSSVQFSRRGADMPSFTVHYTDRYSGDVRSVNTAVAAQVLSPFDAAMPEAYQLVA